MVHVGLRRRPYIGVIKPQLPEKGPFVGVISLVSTVFFLGGLAFGLKALRQPGCRLVRQPGVWRFSERLDWVNLQPLELNSLSRCFFVW